MTARLPDRRASSREHPAPIADHPFIIASEVGGGFQIGWHDDAPDAGTSGGR
jgi:hypothetical protein